MHAYTCIYLFKHKKYIPLYIYRMYVSWNMAFTTAYADAPYFCAALLAPCVLGAKRDEFMFYRCAKRIYEANLNPPVNPNMHVCMFR